MQDQRIMLSDGRHLGFAEYGARDGVPLMFFHGTPGSRYLGSLEKASWIRDHGMRLIVPERPGYGLSDPAPKRRIADWAADVVQLADQLGLQRFHVGGGSGGGPYALACAVKAPARVRSATLICSGCPPQFTRLTRDMVFGNRIMFFLARHAPFLLWRLISASANGMRKRPQKVASRMMRKLGAMEGIHADPQRCERLLRQLQEAYRQGPEGTCRDMLLVARPWGFDVDMLSVPVFLWHGEDDRLMPASCAREFAAHIPGCEAHFVPDAGHMLLAQPEIASQIMARIASVPDETAVA